MIAQIKIYRIYRRLPKGDLQFLANEAGLDLEHYNSHIKRAAGMTVFFYRSEGLTEAARKHINRAFGA